MIDRNEQKAQIESLPNEQATAHGGFTKPLKKTLPITGDLPEEILSLTMEEKQELLRLWEEYKR